MVLVNCPKCDGPLYREVDSEAGEFWFCLYCGSRRYLEPPDPYQKRYSMRKGKRL